MSTGNAVTPVTIHGIGANGNSRQLTKIEKEAERSIAQLRSIGGITAAKIDTFSAVSQRGLQAAAFMTQVEQELAQAVPLSASRLEAVSQVGVLGIAQILMDCANRLQAF